MARQRAQVALSGEHVGKTADLRGLDGHAPKGHIALEKIGDLPLPLLDLERAGAIDQRPARLDHLAGGGEQTLLDDGKTGDVLWALQVRHVGMATNGARRRARRIEQDAGDLAARLPNRGVGGDCLDREIEAVEIADQAVETALRAVDGGDDGACRGKLRRLAARGGAKIDEALAGDL